MVSRFTTHATKAASAPGSASIATALDRLGQLQDGLLDVACDLADAAVEAESATLAAATTATIDALANVHAAAERLAVQR